MGRVVAVQGGDKLETNYMKDIDRNLNKEGKGPVLLLYPKRACPHHVERNRENGNEA